MIDTHMLLSLSHILVLAPALLYVAFSRAATPGWAYSTLLFVGLFMIAYHGYRAFVRIVKKSSYAWVNLIHVMVVAPLLIYIGYNRQDTPRAAYEMLAMLGFAAVGYHIYYLIKDLQVHDTSSSGSQN